MSCEAQRGTIAVSLVRIDNEVSAAILEAVRTITEAKLMRLGGVGGRPELEQARIQKVVTPHLSKWVDATLSCSVLAGV